MGEALAGQEARRFAPDVATGAPEVCYARPLMRNGATQGAVIVRVSLEPIEATWVDAAFRAESEKPLVVDAQGVVVMSSVPAWKRLSLPMLTLTERALPHGAELVRMRPAADENFTAITGLAERMGRITSQLKSFARKAPADDRCLPLQQAIGNAQQLLAARLRDEGVMLRVDVPPALQVRCDGYRLEQVLVNLMANAIDAMAGCDRKELSIGASCEGDRVVVRVADSGAGIPPALSERLFEPFFTTKPAGAGLGLGLVISQHIVRDFGGVLRAVSTGSGAVSEFDVGQAPATLQGEPCSTDTTSP